MECIDTAPPESQQASRELDVSNGWKADFQRLEREHQFPALDTTWAIVDAGSCSRKPSTTPVLFAAG